MYRRGLTVKRIADLCHAVPQTVGRHIRVQRAKYPDIAAEHKANRPADKPHPPGASWQAKVDDLSAFHQARGRYPTTGDLDPVNRRLAQWLSLQRRAERAGALSEERVQMLETLPGWANNQRAEQAAAKWLARLEALQAYRASEGRWPRFRDPVDESERVLGVWLHAQRQKFGAGQLTRGELRHLDSIVPGWNAWRVKRLAKASDAAAADAPG